MNILEMSREDFDKVPTLDCDVTNPVKLVFRRLVIIPTDEEYEFGGGYREMHYCLVDKDNEPICVIRGGSDVCELDGIGGADFRRLLHPEYKPAPHGWSIDCLPCGYVSLFATGANLTVETRHAYSLSFELFTEEPEG